jgi:hypothetical protein
MADDRTVTFICPACGRNEVPLPEGWDPENTTYQTLAELDDCDEAQEGQYIYGDGHTRGFGGVVRDLDGEGAARERWIPPRAVIAYQFYRDLRHVGGSEPAQTCYPSPLFRNRVVNDGIENVFVAMAFLPHGDVPEPEMRARGEQLAKAMK